MPDKVLPNLPHRPREFAALSQSRVERVDKKVDFFFPNNERRQNLDHIHRVTRNLGENAMLSEHLSHDHLRKEDLVDLMQKFPCHLELKLVRLMKLNRDHQTFAANFLDERVFGAQGIEAFDQECAHL